MKKHFILAAVCLSASFASAQKLPERTYRLGPAVGFTQMGYGDFSGRIGYTVGETPGGINFGVAGSYEVRRCLLDVKLLYQKRTYGVGPNMYIPDSSPNRVIQTETDYSVLTIPFSVSYRLTRDTPFQWFVGGNVAVEYLLSTGKQVLYTADGQASTSPTNYIGIPINLGLGMQTTFRYRILPRATLQLEPAIRYYFTDGFPTQSTGTFQFQGTAAVLFRL